MVDRFSKIAYYIPITINISNRGSQFVLNFIKKLSQIRYSLVVILGLNSVSEVQYKNMMIDR